MRARRLLWPYRAANCEAVCETVLDWRRKGNGMKRWIVASIAIAVALGGAGYGGYRLYEYQEWKSDYGKALDAYKRAYDYRDAGVLLYEPRLKDFDTAMDALERLPVLSEDAVSSKGKLRICAGDIDEYRKIDDMNLETIRLGRTPDLDLEYSVEKSAGSCIRDAIEAGDMP